MPELPEVEGFRRCLEAVALDKVVRHVEVKSARILRGISAPDLGRIVKGQRIERTRRHGKFLLAGLDKCGCLTFHFGMSGGLAYFKRMEDDPAYDQLRLDFQDGDHLAYQSRRLLGGVGYVDDADAFIVGEGLGPDALDPTLDQKAFLNLMAGRRGQVKAALMDQHFMAGIGNEYSDEILFQARLHPKAIVQFLSRSELETLYRKMRSVLRTAIDSGAGAEDLLDRLPATYLLPHRKVGQQCPRCGSLLSTLKVASRTAYYCPKCQPMQKRT